MIKMFTKKRRKGFTLIELIVVIAILGILAAIAIPRLGTFRDDAEESAAIASARTIASAVAMYQAANGNTDEPAVSALTAYLNDAATLASDFTIGYKSGSAGEIEKITLTTAINGKSVWTPGSDELVAP